MPTNLTGSRIADSYVQLLHIDGGVAAEEKPIYTGVGVALPLEVGLTSVSMFGLRFSALGITSKVTNGNIAITPDGTGQLQLQKVAITSGSITGITDLAIADGGTGASTAMAARGNLGITDLATQDPANINITGGSITGITDLAIADGGTGASTAMAARTNLGLGTIATQDANNVNITGGTITGVDLTVPFEDVSGRDYGAFYSIIDQSAAADTPTPVRFEVTTASLGVTVANNGSSQPTRITFPIAGTYLIAARLQFLNADVANVNTLVWFRKNEVDVIASASEVNVPKTGDGGRRVCTLTIAVTVTANQYVEVIWATPDVDVTLHHNDPLVSPYVAPAVASASVVATRLA